MLNSHKIQKADTESFAASTLNVYKKGFTVPGSPFENLGACVTYFRFLFNV